MPVALKTGMNHVEYVATMLQDLQAVIQQCNQQGGMAKPEQITGMQLVAQHIEQHIQILSQDKNEKAAVTAFQKQLSKLMNFAKAFAQRLQEAMKKQQQQSQQQGPDPKDAAKAQVMVAQAKSKMQLAKESHAQKTAQRQLSWEKDEERKRIEFQQEHQHENVRTAAEIQRDHAKAGAEIANSRLKALSITKAMMEVRNESHP